MNWSRILQWSAEKYPDKECLLGLGKRQTYADTEERVNSLAQGLMDLGIRRGDVVAILLYNCCEYLEITFAVNQIGAVWLPLNFRLAGDEFQYILENSGARGLISDGLKEIGVPVLNLEVDCVDKRNFAEGQLRTRIEAFVEMLESRPRAAAIGD